MWGRGQGVAANERAREIEGDDRVSQISSALALISEKVAIERLVLLRVSRGVEGQRVESGGIGARESSRWSREERSSDASMRFSIMVSKTGAIRFARILMGEAWGISLLAKMLLMML